MKKTPKHKIFEGMKHFAAAFGVAYDYVQAAKNAGCPAFLKGGRIDSKVFMKWVSENPDFKKPTADTSLKEQKIFEEVRKLRIANDAKEKMSVLRSAVCSSIAATEKAIDELLEAKLEKEYPASVSGLDIPGARVYGRNLRDLIRVEICKMGRFWKI